MRDPYLYEGTDVLRNLLGIKDRKLLEEAESGYVTEKTNSTSIIHIDRGTGVLLSTFLLPRRARL